MGVTPPQRHWRSYGTETALAAIEAAHASEVAALRERADAAEVSRVTAQAMVDRVGALLAEAGTTIERL